MKIALILVLSANYLSFLWSVLSLFKPKKGVVILKYRFLQVATVLIWILSLRTLMMTNVEGNRLDFVVLAIESICLLLFWHQSRIVKRHRFGLVFSNGHTEKLVQEGLYQWVRNPFYLIYITCYLTISLYLTNIPCLILSAVLLGIYFNAARSEEAQFLESGLTEEYRNYLQRTGRFLPRIFGLQVL